MNEIGSALAFFFNKLDISLQFAGKVWKKLEMRRTILKYA